VQVVLATHAELSAVLRHVHPAVFFEDLDAPFFIDVDIGLVARAVRDVVGDEVAQVAVDVFPRRKSRQPSACGAAVFDLLPRILGIDEDDRKIIDGDQSLFSSR
jgi:hypothetical protein